jgi:hypothetical protein
VAAAKIPFPGWLAVTEHVPTPTMFTVALPLRVQTDGGLTENCTVRFELADAYDAIENGEVAVVTWGSELKLNVMVCEPEPVTIMETGVDVVEPALPDPPAYCAV